MTSINSGMIDYFTHQEIFVDLLQSGYDIHVDFYTSLCGFSAQCDKSDKILESIKCALKIAEEQAEFDHVVPEIKKNSDDLLATVVSGKKTQSFYPIENHFTQRRHLP